MSKSTIFSRLPEVDLPNYRQVLVVLGVICLLIIPTGAVILNDQADTIGPEGEIVLEPYDGPNGRYAEIDSNSQLTVNITEHGVNPEATTDIKRIFTISNVGNDTKQVWITHTHKEALTFYDAATGEPIGDDNRATIEPGERIVVSLRVDTTNPSIRAGETIVATLIVHVLTFDSPRVEAPGSVDFGNVTNGSDATKGVTIRNTGSAALEVRDLLLGGPDEAAFELGDIDEPLTVPPGGTVSVPVRFAPTSPGGKSATLEIVTNDTERPTVTTTLSGRSVSPRLTVVGGSSVNFGEVKTGVAERKTITIRNDAPAPVLLTESRLSGAEPAAFSVVTADLPVLLAPGGTHDVVVEFSPTTTGRKSASLIVTPADSPSRGVTVELSGVGVQTDINVEPVPIGFGGVGKDKTATLPVTVSNRGAVPLRVNDVGLTGTDADQFTIDAGGARGTLRQGEKRTFTVSFTPTRAGNLSADLRIESNDSETPTHTVEVTGEGLPAEIEATPGELDFGNVTVGTTKKLTVTVQNEEGSPTDLRVGTTTIVGANPESFSITGGAAPFTLEPGEEKDIEVTYAPKTAGIKTAQLRILSDAREQQIDVWMSNAGWRIRVEEVPPGAKGVDAEEEEFQLDTSRIDRRATNVEVDVNDLPEEMEIAVNVSQPGTRQRKAGIDEVRFRTKRTGDFDMNFVHGDDPPLPDSTSYSPPAGWAITQYVTLWHSVPDGSFENPSLRYRVKKASLPDGATADEVEFRRFEDGEWKRYDATFVRETSTHYIYRVDLPGFSEFVLAAPDADATGGPGTPTPDGDDGSDAPAPSAPAPSTPAPSTPAPGTPGEDDQRTPAPPAGTQPREVTVERGDTTITFPDVVDGAGRNLEGAVSVQNLPVPTPGGPDGPRARIAAREDVDEGAAATVDVGEVGISVSVSNERRVVRRLEAKGIDALTLIGRPIPLTGTHSLFESKDSIDDDWRMIRRVEITVPPEFEDRPAIIYIRVPRERFGETAPENATIARLNGGWQLLDTEVARETPEAVVLRAQTPGFSEFAVFADNEVSYSWEVETYDEPLTGVTIDPSFDDPGVYNVTLTVTDSFGLTDTARYRVLANDVPEVTIERQEPLAPNRTVTLSATVDDEMGNVSINWTFPDGSTASGAVVNYTFRSGSQTVRVVAEDEFGARGTDEETYRVGTAPSLDVSVPAFTRRFAGPALLVLLALPLIVLLWRIRGSVLPAFGHPPEVEVFERPRVNLDKQRVVIPRLRVVDRGEDLDTIAVTVLDYDGRTIGHEAGSIGGGREYEGSSVYVSARPGERLEPGIPYVVEVQVTDAADGVAVRGRAIEVDPDDDELGPGDGDPGSGYPVYPDADDRGPDGADTGAGSFIYPYDETGLPYR